MTDTWFRVVKHYPNNWGPTIPFILGALRRPVGHVLPSHESREELSALLVAMRDEAPDGYSIVIRGCGNLGEPIVTHSDIEPSGLLRFDSPSKKGRALHFQPFYDMPATDFGSLIDCFWERYENIISKGCFSKNGTWHAFDPTELAKLKSYCDIE